MLESLCVKIRINEMGIYKKLFILFINFLFISMSGCISGAVDTSEERERLTELFVGNALPIIDIDTLVTEKKLVPVSKNKAYRIDNRVGIEGDYYVYNIYTPHGTISAKGTAALVEYCYDAEVLEMILSSNFGEVINITLEEDSPSVNTEVVDAKVYKIDSIVGIGRRFNQEYSEDFDRDIIIDNVGDRNTIYGAYYDNLRMLLAYKLGLDVYSANFYVQRFLDSLIALGESDLKGILDINLVQPDVNIHRGRKNIDATSQSRDLYPGSKSLLIENRIVNSDPESIKFKLLQLYKIIFPNIGFSGTSIEKLIYSSHYSIREELYIFAYLNDMRSVKYKRDIVDLLASAETAFEARQYFIQLELLHAYYASMGGLHRFVALSNMIGAIDNSAQVIVIPTWDHTRDRDKVRKLLVEVKNIKKHYSAASANVWFVGDCDKNTKKTAKAAGINIRDGVVTDNMFRFTIYRKLTYEFAPGDPLVNNVARLTPNPLTQYQRVNRPLPTTLLPDSENIAKSESKDESTIIIETPDKPKPKKHDPRNLREFGIGVKIIPKEELVNNDVPGIAQEGIGDNFEQDETGSGDGKLPRLGEDPVKVDSTPIF